MKRNLNPKAKSSGFSMRLCTVLDYGPTSSCTHQRGTRWTGEKLQIRICVSDGCYTPCSGGGWQVGLFPDFLSRTIWEGAHYNLTYGSPAEQRQEKGVKVEKAWILFFSYSLGFGTVGKGPEILVCSLEGQGQLLTMVTV